MARTQTATATSTSTSFAGRLLKSAPKGHQYHGQTQPRSSSATATLSVDNIPAIPGFRTSATFLSSLRANLHISDDDLLPSPLSTPPSLRASTELNSVIPPPSPLTRAAMPRDEVAPPEDASVKAEGDDAPIAAASAADPLAGVPELTTFVARTAEDKVAGLKLVADSIAQQRQTASRILISHPLNVCAFGIFLAAVAQYMYRGAGDLPVMFTTFGGVVMAALVSVRWLTRGYILMAEELGWAWLADSDTVVLTRFGDQAIGCCVLGWEKADRSGSRRKKPGRGLVRAWTVRLKYRRKGVGRALLEEAVDLVNQKGGDGIAFADDHANSGRILKPAFYNAAFDKKDAQARALLDEVVAERAAWRKR